MRWLIFASAEIKPLLGYSTAIDWVRDAFGHLKSLATTQVRSLWKGGHCR